MNVNSERVKCTRCLVNLPKDHFSKKRSGDLYKRCTHCVEKVRHYRGCEHNKRRSRCKECGGSEICQHGRRRDICKECGGIGICQHGRQKHICKECNGASICQHGKERHTCKKCEGSCVCQHGKQRRYCKDCEGACMCMHQRRKITCKECVGNWICDHGKIKRVCKICDPQSHLAGLVRSRIYQALKSDKSKHSLEYLGTDIKTFREHIQAQFKEATEDDPRQMTWENHGEVWHIDHIIPLAYAKPTLEEVMERLHYMNCQPLWAEDNMIKGNRFIG